MHFTRKSTRLYPYLTYISKRRVEDSSHVLTYTGFDIHLVQDEEGQCEAQDVKVNC